MQQQDFLDIISPSFTGSACSISVPKETPKQRQQQRLMFRNNRNLYKGRCAKSDKTIISMYRPETGYTVYDQHIWRGDEWDALAYGQDMDLGKSFTEQFQLLMQTVPRINLINTQHENSEYCNFTIYNKDCYMLDTSASNEACFYSTRIFDSNQCSDSVALNACQLCYECLFCDTCFRCLRSSNCTNCQDCLACKDMFGCQYCFGCYGLENARYCIYNKQLSKEEYEQTIDTCRLQLLQDPTAILAKIAVGGPYLIQCEQVSGNNLDQCKECLECYASKHLEDCAYVTNATHLEQCRDIDNNDNSQLNYQLIGGEKNYHCCFCDICRFGKELRYCSLCMYCENCFGCVGLKRKSYCIFNKQYEKEEYEKKVAMLVEHMQKTGERGVFFDPTLSPFAYNESVAQEYYPLGENQAIERGFAWYTSQDDKQKYNTEHVLKSSELPEPGSVDTNFTKQIIVCETTGKPYRFTNVEIALYQKLKIPFSSYHPDERVKRRRERIG